MVEGFALFVEWQYSLDNNLNFDEKMSLLHQSSRDLFDSVQEYHNQFGLYGMMCQAGFSRDYVDVVELLQKVNPECELALHYGSKKPFSDIDVFTIGANPTHNIQNEWFDMYHYDYSTFFHMLKNLDPAVTDPIFTGLVIKGDVALQEQLQQFIFGVPITKHVIEYNLRKAHDVRNFVVTMQDGNEKNNTVQYAATLEKNAVLLLQGYRGIVRENLL